MNYIAPSAQEIEIHPNNILLTSGDGVEADATTTAKNQLPINPV